MDLTEIKSGGGHKRNRIVLKDLSKRHKEILMSGGIVTTGIGVGIGAFSLYSMKEPNTIPEATLNFNEPKDSVERIDGGGDNSEEIAIYSDQPIPNMDELNVSFGEAFKIAREEVGPGGWFVWKERVFNTYYKEEWDNLSSVQKTEYLASLQTEEISDNDIQNEVPVFADSEVSTKDENHGEVIHARNELNEVSQETTASGSIESAVFVGETDNAPLEFELPEDSVIYEISAEDLDAIDSVVFDASENDVFMEERSNEKLENISPIQLKNLDGNHAPSEAIGLAQNKVNEVEEYPWGEPIINNDQLSDKSGLRVNVDQESDLENGASDKTEGVNEYPWGETISNESNVSFARDIEVINGVGLNLGNSNKLSNQLNQVEEYPWGEQVNQVDDSSTSPIDQPNDFIESPLNDPLSLENENDFDIDFAK